MNRPVTYETLGGRSLDNSALGKIFAHVKEVDVKQSGTDRHGAIMSGRLVIHGPLVRAVAYYGRRMPNSPYLRTGNEDGIGPYWDDAVVNGKFDGDESNVYLLKVATTNESRASTTEVYRSELICLVLACRNEESNMFSRIGYVSRYWPEEEKWFQNATTDRTIMIE